MDEKLLNQKYVSAVRSRKKGGARWQKVGQTVITSQGEESSPYRRHVGEGREPDLAAGLEIPRNFSVTTAMRNAEIEAEVKGRVRKLIDLAKQVLTERQYAVFILVAVKDPALTEREVAKVLSISPGRVHQLSAAAMSKLRRAYDERT